MDFSLQQDGGSVRRDGHQRHGGLMKTPVSRLSSVTTSVVVYGENAFWANWGLTHSTTILPVLSPVLMTRPRALLNPGPQADFLDHMGLIADSLCGSWCESAPLIETNASSRLVAPVRTPWFQVSQHVPNTGTQATGKSAEEEPPAGSALRRLLMEEEQNCPCGVFVLKGL